MRKILALIFGILLIAGTAHAIVVGFSGPPSGGGSVTYGYAGWPTDASGNPNAFLGAVSGYSSIDEGVIVWQWTATDGGTINAVNMRFSSSTFTSGDVGYYAVYVNSTLVATVQMQDSWMDGDWSGYQTVAVESGESLTFGSGDVLEFGVAWNVPISGASVYRDQGSSIHFYYDVVTWGGYPPSTISTSESSNVGLCSILRYES